MFPTRVVLRPVVCAGMALALRLPAAEPASAGGSNPITEGFHYSPVPAPAVAPPAESVPAPEASGRQPRKRVQDPAQRLPEVPVAPASPATAAAPGTPSPAPVASTAAAPAPPTAPGTLVLPKVTVTGQKDKPRPLPQLHIATPVKDLPVPEWESLEGRRARLVQKHFTALEQKLNSREWLEAEAAHLEAIEVAAAELNRIATVLDLSAALGLDDPAAQKALRAEFLRAFYDRPR